jgi:hypothetical protein
VATATTIATAGRESRVRVLRDQVQENELKIEDYKQRALIGALATAKLAPVAHALESSFDLLDNIVDPRDYLGDEYAPGGYGYSGAVPSAIWHREEGRLYPVFINEWDLRPIRAMGFYLGTFHPMGVGIMSKLTNYTIGKGITATVTADKRMAQNPDVEQLVSIAQSVVDDFIEFNDVTGGEGADREVFLRSHREGDGGISLWHEGNGQVALRFVEPDQICQPGNEREILYEMGYTGDPSNMLFGVHSEDGDVSIVHGYYCQWSSNGQDWDYLPGGKYPVYAQEPMFGTASKDTWMEFYKSNVLRQTKRGLTDFISADAILTLSQKVLRNTGEGAAVQAAIAYIRKHASGTTAGQIDQFQIGISSNQIQRSTALGSQTTNIQQIKPGTVLDVTNQDYVNGPMGDTERGKGYVEVADALARVAAVRWDMPEWMVSGNADHTNKATAFVAESPFLKNIEVGQDKECGFWRRILWKVIEFNQRVGKFGDTPFSVLKKCLHLDVVCPQLNVREPEKETARRQILVAGGVMSKKTWAKEEGLDYDQEVTDGAKVESPQQEAGPPMPKGIGYGKGESRGYEGGPGSGPHYRGGRQKPPTRSDRAKAAYKPATVEKQRLGEAEQKRLASQLKAVNDADNAAFDITSGKNAIEVKTVMDNNNDKITMHPESRIRKEEFAKSNGMRPHTVAIDVRGGKREYYYKAGVGAFRLGSMEKVSLGELKARLSA